ncbi:hypothetical protein F4780DRAFT_733027 [Xylariomycetidae sp. FL0641]|nr:hypothetical protein F4780DRAFT_733027 [Xylariomycetidae sp. FL0641]
MPHSHAQQYVASKGVPVATASTGLPLRLHTVCQTTTPPESGTRVTSPAVQEHGGRDIQQDEQPRSLAIQSFVPGAQGNNETRVNNLTAEPEPPRCFEKDGVPSRGSDEADDPFGHGAERVPCVRSYGPPSEVLFECPGPQYITYQTAWYRLRGLLDFLICTRCFEDHVRGTRHEGSFEAHRQGKGALSTCRFWVPRIVHDLWPDALKTGHIGALRDFMIRRPQLGDCSQLESPHRRTSRQWFISHSGEFAACEACYEDLLRGTCFAVQVPQLQSNQLGAKARSIACQAGQLYIRRALEYYMTSGDWDGFLAAIQGRLSAVSCTKEAEGTRVQTWYRSRRPIRGLRVCDACFLDQIAYTPFEGEFTTMGNDEWGPTELRHRVCTFSIDAVNIAWASAVARRSFGIFWNAVVVILGSPKCRTRGTKGNPSYTIDDDRVNFNVCQACYAGVIAPFELGEFFVLAEQAEEEDTQCDLNTASPRFCLLARGIAHATNVGDFGIFRDYVRRLSTCPPCPRAQATSNETWYFIEDCAVCPECYEATVRGTVLAQSHRVVRLRIRFPVLCSVYSERMRREWARACSTGEISLFLEAARHRQQTYFRTVPAAEEIRRDKRQRMSVALDRGVMSAMHEAVDQHARTIGIGDGLLHGNNDLGWHRTWQGAESTRLTQVMQEEIGRVLSPEDWATISRLEREWAAVE